MLFNFSLGFIKTQSVKDPFGMVKNCHLMTIFVIIYNILYPEKVQHVVRAYFSFLVRFV